MPRKTSSFAPYYALDPAGEDERVYGFPFTDDEEEEEVAFSAEVRDEAALEEEDHEETHEEVALQAPRRMVAAGTAPSTKRKRVDNTTSLGLVTASSTYQQPVFPIEHRFGRIPRVEANRGQVMGIFRAGLNAAVTAGRTTTKTADDTAGLLATMWLRLGLDLTENNELSRLFWSCPNNEPKNSVLKNLNKVLNAHKHQIDKYRGIINKLQRAFDDKNAGGSGPTAYLNSGDIHRLFGLKTRKQETEEQAAGQIDWHAPIAAVDNEDGGDDWLDDV